MGDKDWLQAKLPVSVGGLGLRGAEDHASAAHIASLLNSEHLAGNLLGCQPEDLMDIPASSLADHSAKQGEEVTLESVAGRNQRMMTKQIDQNNLQILKNQLEKQRDIARLNSLGLPFAGAWLVSAPVVSLGLHLQPHEFVLALKYRLGMAIYDREGPCPACLRPSDRFGDHALCCGFWGERITRHNLLRDHLYDLAASACLSPIKEGRFLLPGADRRPADVLLPSWEGGRDAALDVTVVNSLGGNGGGHSLLIVILLPPLYLQSPSCTLLNL